MTSPSLYTCLLLLGELVGNGIRPPRSVGGTPGVVAGGLVGTTSADAANLSSLSASESLQGIFIFFIRMANLTGISGFICRTVL